MVVESPCVESNEACMSAINEIDESHNSSSGDLRKNLASTFDKKHVEESKTSRKRPPIAPNNKAKAVKRSESSNKLLSVFLRIRPTDVRPSSSTSTEANANTIEVINDDEGNATTIRAYPPSKSNAAKSARGKKNVSKKRIKSGYSSDDSIGSTSSTLGVKEYSFSQVFTPQSVSKM